MSFAALFLQAFIAATIVPLSSEAGLLAAIHLGMPVGEALVAASLGNCLACLLNYGLGYCCSERTRARLDRSAAGRKALAFTGRWQGPALLLAWLPVIGDPLTIAAGVFRLHLVLFVPVVFGLRIGRYLLLTLL